MGLSAPSRIIKSDPIKRTAPAPEPKRTEPAPAKEPARREREKTPA